VQQTSTPRLDLSCETWPDTCDPFFVVTIGGCISDKTVDLVEGDHQSTFVRSSDRPEAQQIRNFGVSQPQNPGAPARAIDCLRGSGRYAIWLRDRRVITDIPAPSAGASQRSCDLRCPRA
jgi:hypothetical protein